MYHILNIISGFFEIGIVLYGMKNYGLIGAMLGALCYQLGNLIPSPISISKRTSHYLMVISLFSAILSFDIPIMIYLSVFCVTAVLQNVRNHYKDLLQNRDREHDSVDWTKEKKRFIRILGFAVSFLFNSLTGIICILIIWISLLRDKQEDLFQLKKISFNIFDWILLIHEMHYFVYCYCMLLLVYQKEGVVCASLSFFLSWLMYVFSPRLYAKLEKRIGDYRKTFVIGHCLVGIFLFMIFLGNTYEIKWFFWLLTGIGGTTEYCIEKLEKRNSIYIKRNHNAAENMGHIAGVVLSILILVVTKDLMMAVGCSIIFVILALVMMLIPIKRSGKNYENKSKRM